jgi:hypothetical protein
VTESVAAASGAATGDLDVAVRPQPSPRLGPAHDVFSSVAALAATGADAPVGLVALGEADLVRLRERRDAHVTMPLHGTPRLREVLADVVGTTRRLSVADLTDPGWGVDPDDPQLLGVRAIAVAPVVQSGLVVGVVGAADTLSRPWSSDELAHLTELARILAHDLTSRTRVAAADRVVRGWGEVATAVDGTIRGASTLVTAAGQGDDPQLRARAALVQDRLDALAEDLQRVEDTLTPARAALDALQPVDLRWGVTAAVRTAARSVPGVRVRPRLHPEPLPVLADSESVRSGVLALLDAVTTAAGEGEVHVRLELVAGSPDDAAAGPMAVLVVEAPHRTCDVAVLATAVGRFETLVRHPAADAPVEPPALVATGEGTTVHGRTVSGTSGPEGVRLETSWRVDVG